MKKVEIYDDQDSVEVEDEYSITTFDVYPKVKNIRISMGFKNDVFYNNSTVEYRISTNPLLLEMRTIELSHEPPKEWSIKDGVVLESEIRNKDFLTPDRMEDRIEGLKRDTEWAKVSLLNNPEVNLYLLSKHPEIIPKEDYRKFLRQSIERIKLGVSKVEEVIKKDTQDLQLNTADYGKYIWYIESETEKKEGEEYWKLSEEEQNTSKYGKKLKYIEALSNSLFKEDSIKYIGISEHEFRYSEELVGYIEKVLDNKHTTKSSNVGVGKKSGSKMKWVIVFALSIIALSWGIWTAIGVFVLGVIIINTLSKN